MTRSAASICFALCFGFVGCGGSGGIKGGGTGGIRTNDAGLASSSGGATAATTGSGEGTTAGGGTGSGSTSPGGGGSPIGVGGSARGSGGAAGLGGTGGSTSGVGGQGSGGIVTGGSGGIVPSDAGANDGSVTPKYDATSGSCPAFTPCGGDVVGTWHLKSECASTIASSGSCVYGVSMLDVSQYNLTFTFAADGTVALSVSGTMNETLRYSAGCFTTDAGAAAACANLQTSAEQGMRDVADAGTFPTSVWKFACAADSTQACVCDETMGYDPGITETGTYTIAGTQIMVGPLSRSPADAGLGDAGAAQPDDYCVSGNTLTLRTTDSPGSALFVFTR